MLFEFKERPKRFSQLAGILAHVSVLESHLRTLWVFVGITELVFVRAIDNNVDVHEDRAFASVDAAAERVFRRLFPQSAPKSGVQAIRERHARG